MPWCNRTPPKGVSHRHRTNGFASAIGRAGAMILAGGGSDPPPAQVCTNGPPEGKRAMSIKSDRWITRMAREHRMIEPFADRQGPEGGLPHGVSPLAHTTPPPRARMVSSH